MPNQIMIQDCVIWFKTASLIQDCVVLLNQDCTIDSSLQYWFKTALL